MHAQTAGQRGGNAELLAWLRLNYSPGIGPLAVQRLLRAFGLPQQVLSRDLHSLQQVLPPREATALLAEPPAALRALLERAPDWLSQPGRHLITLDDARYPRALLHIADPPPLLWAWGELSLLARPRLLAVVGSRHPSAQGERDAHRFAQALAGAGVTVVSGLAHGVDAQAHRGALQAEGGGSTIAVLGTGCDRVYPAAQRELAQDIARDGLLLSEWPLGAPALAHHFPRRNRIISGLACGVLVTEAALRSGSLITARLAAEQGREVFALPGSIHNPMARGCHRLLRDGAQLVETPDDILRELGWGQAPAAPGAAPGAPLAPPAQRVLDFLGGGILGFDALLARSGATAARLNEHLLELELLGLVARLPGGRLQRVTPADQQPPVDSGG